MVFTFFFFSPLFSGLLTYLLDLVYWEASVIGFAVEKRTINHVGKRVAGNMTSSSTNKRGKSSGQRQELEELKRKKQMIEKYTSEGSKKAEEIGDVTEKWKDAALLALEELRTKMQQLEGKSLTQLCRTWDIDPKLLDIEDEEKEEEEEEERQENDDD